MPEFICQPTDTPPADSIDIAALRERYRHERDRRMIGEATEQYTRTEGGRFAGLYEVDPYTPFREREPIADEIDVAVLGAGWTGVLAAYHLKQAGIESVRNIDHAGDWGGVWYWNRYPGLQCDNDAYCYLPLLEETGFMPSKKFADGFEILDYINLIVDRFGLRDNGLFHTLVRSIQWDASIKRWRIQTNRGDDIRARFVVMANGLLNIPKLPGIPGIDSFKGKLFHTSRWDYEYTGGGHRDTVLDRLGDKRVAIVGTGATAIQAVPFLGQYAKELYVLQRTPSTVDRRENPATDPDWVRTLEPGWQKARQQNFQRAAITGFLPGESDLVCDIWTEINRNLSAELAAEEREVSIEEYLQRREVVDYQVMERLRNRVAELVEDPETAEALKPWYRFLCKRPASNNEFYPSFNRPNVKLIDVSASRGIEGLTEDGFVANGIEYPVDCVIFASGFEVTSKLERKWGLDVIEGRDGRSLYEHWRKGYRTLHGMSSNGFPNLFFSGGFLQSAFNASTTEMMNRHAFHIAQIISGTLATGGVTVEPTEAVQDAWGVHVRETAIDQSQYNRECTPSYFNSEGNEEGLHYLGDTYGPGWDAFEAVLDEWRASGMPGMEITKA